MSIVTTVVYFFLCYIVALMGKHRKFGFWGYLFLSILVTPIIGLLTVIASDSKKEDRDNV